MKLAFWMLLLFLPVHVSANANETHEISCRQFLDGYLAHITDVSFDQRLTPRAYSIGPTKLLGNLPEGASYLDKHNIIDMTRATIGGQRRFRRIIIRHCPVFRIGRRCNVSDTVGIDNYIFFLKYDGAGNCFMDKVFKDGRLDYFHRFCPMLRAVAGAHGKIYSYDEDTSRMSTRQRHNFRNMLRRADAFVSRSGLNRNMLQVGRNPRPGLERLRENCNKYQSFRNLPERAAPVQRKRGAFFR